VAPALLLLVLVLPADLLPLFLLLRTEIFVLLFPQSLPERIWRARQVVGPIFDS